MIKGLLNALFAILVVCFALFTLYNQMPGTPIGMKEINSIEQENEIIEYGPTPVFSENLRFNHNNISYTISNLCSTKNYEAMLNAFQIFEQEMPPITFYKGDSNADIKVICDDKQEMTGLGLFAAGEGGPSKIINTTTFKTIMEGTIYLYQEERCNYPIVELHELLHVFGFDHINNSKSLMYEISNCDQRITPDMKEYISKLYSIKPASDAIIKEINATKKGRYLDFEITISNEGLLDIEKINLTILQEEKVVEIFEIDEIKIGYARTLQATNVRLPLTNSQKITFILDKENSIEEILKSNNIKEMTIID